MDNASPNHSSLLLSSQQNLNIFPIIFQFYNETEPTFTKQKGRCIYAKQTTQYIEHDKLAGKDSII